MVVSALGSCLLTITNYLKCLESVLLKCDYDLVTVYSSYFEIKIGYLPVTEIYKVFTLAGIYSCDFVA